MHSITAGQKARIWESLAKREVIILMLIGALLFLLAALGLSAAGSRVNEVLLHGMQDFGIALIEAAFVMVIIDFRAAREQLRQSLEVINRATLESKKLIEESIEVTKMGSAASQRLIQSAVESLFDTVYKNAVPKELVRLYEDFAFKLPLFRRRHEYHYTLGPSPAGMEADGVFTVTVNHSYEMENLTDQMQPYEFYCELGLPPAEKMAALCKYFSLYVNDEEVKGPGAPVPQVEQRSGYRALVLRHRVDIAPRAKCRFDGSWQAIRRSREDEFLMTTWPSDGIIVRVTYAPNLAVTVNALHPKELTPIPTGTSSRKYKLDAGMMIGHGVCLSWEAIS